MNHTFLLETPLILLIYCCHASATHHSDLVKEQVVLGTHCFSFLFIGILRKNYKHLCSKEIFLAYVTVIRCYGYVQNVFEKRLLRNKTNSLKFLNRTYDFKVISFK